MIVETFDGGYAILQSVGTGFYLSVTLSALLLIVLLVRRRGIVEQIGFQRYRLLLGSVFGCVLLLAAVSVWRFLEFRPGLLLAFDRTNFSCGTWTGQQIVPWADIEELSVDMHRTRWLFGPLAGYRIRITLKPESGKNLPLRSVDGRNVAVCEITNIGVPADSMALLLEYWQQRRQGAQM